MPLSVGLLGASGHVGSRVLRQLLSAPDEVVERVITLDRRVIPDTPTDPRLRRHVVDMSSAESLQEAALPLLSGVDVVVATLGIGSGLGSLAAFEHVEVALPTAFARAAVQAGAQRAVLLTAAGADVERRFSWLLPHVARGRYFHLKGLVEQRFEEASFPQGVLNVRPGGLLGTSHLPHFVDWFLERIDWMFPVRFRCIHIAQLADILARAVIEPEDSWQGAATVLEAEGLFARLRG